MASQFKTFTAAALLISAAVVYINSTNATPREKMIEDRLQPVGKVDLAGAAPAASAGPRTVESIYERTCKVCHAAGVAGAPKTGDKAAWGPRVAQGKPTLYDHAMKGFKGMPPKGTCMDCSDPEIKQLVDYLVKQAS
jgi:cytochrome c5